MKKIGVCLIVLSLMLCHGHVYALEKENPNDAVVKLGRGVANVVSSPLEYLIQYQVMEDKHNVVVALVGSIFYGTLFTVKRIAGGAYEIVTFPVPFPSGYAPLMRPETPMEAYRESQGSRSDEL